MAILNPKTAVTTRTQNVQYWMALDEKRQEWLAEVIVRRPTGILYLVHRYPGNRPARRVLYRDACRHGRFSSRPYQLAQACDGSIGSCVIALFCAFCEARQFDPIGLLQRAYPDEPACTAQERGDNSPPGRLGADRLSGAMGPICSRGPAGITA
jgi:hypothetical protein